MVQVKFCWESLIYCFLLQLSLLCLGGGAVCVCAQRLQDERGLTKSNLGLELEEDFKAGHSCSGCSPHICQVKTKQRGLNIVQMCVKPNFRNQLSSSFLLKWRSQPDISEDRDGSTLHTLGAPRFSSSPQRSSCCSKNLSLAFPLSLVSSNPSVLSLSEQCKLQGGSQLSEKIHNHNCFGDAQRTWAALRGSGLFLLLCSPLILEAQEFRPLTSSQAHSEHTSTLDSCIILHGSETSISFSIMKTFSPILGQNCCRTQPGSTQHQLQHKQEEQKLWWASEQEEDSTVFASFEYLPFSSWLICILDTFGAM